MDKNSNVYVIKFAVILCVLASAGLSFAYNALRPLQIENEEFDQKRNVLSALGLYDPADPTATREKLEQMYAARITEQVVEGKGGTSPETAPETVTVLENAVPADLKKIRDARELRRKRALYLAKDEAGKPLGVALPIQCKGLWSTLYGYLALGPDGNAVRGITFYKHGETPGLGGEVDNPDWKKQWTEGRKILGADGTLVGVQVKKGHVDPQNELERTHMVDGLSGATITSKGVSTDLLKELQWFRPYLRQFWGK